ncbi:MAG TPA: hypothetical protein VM118_01195 [Acidobacteriota bacterium]|nr:hypothetical protein [Acidobacteriota bacterium]
MEPIDFIPSGKLGSHRHSDKVLQIQTEFARRPRPRLTSSVVVDGQIVHKVDRDWPDDLSREENQLRLEIDLQEQHRSVMALVTDRAAELVAGDPPPITPGGTGYEAPTIRDTIAEVLRTCTYTLAFYEFDQSGCIVYRTYFRDVVAEWDQEFNALSAIIFKLPEIIRVGSLRHGIAHFSTENLIIARIKERAFGILTDRGATADTLRRDFPELFEAVSDAGNPV